MFTSFINMYKGRAAFLLMFLVGVAWAAGRLDAEGLTQSGASCVFAVLHQSTGGQPYPRGININTTIPIVQGSDAVVCGRTIDTGSGTLLSIFNASTSSPTCRPAADKPVAPNVGKCPNSDQGIEAGGTYKLRGTRSAFYSAQQVYKGGLINKHEAGFCYQLPQKPWCDTNCHPTSVPDSAVVLGSALPRAVRSPDSLSSALLTPLNSSIESPPEWPYNALPKTHTARAQQAAANGARVQGYQGGASTTVSPASGSGLVPWDTRVHNQSAVLYSVYQAYQQHCTSAHAAAANSTLAMHYGFKSQQCSHPREVCGSLVLGSPQFISAPLTPSAPPSSTTASLLPSMHPSNVNITLEGGAIASAPPQLQANWSCGRHHLPRSGIAACTKVQSSCRFMEAAGTCNAGGTPSDNGVPQQAYKACHISKQLTGSWNQQPTSNKNTNWGAKTMPNSIVELNAATPCAVRCLSSLSSAPPAPLSASPHDLCDTSASPETDTLGCSTVVTGASLPGCQGATATTLSSPSRPVSVLCDTTANGHNMMLDNAYQAHMDYCAGACAAAINSAMTKQHGVKTQGCDPGLPGPDLNLSWPQYHFITLATSTASIANAGGLWLAGLWLYGRFVIFDPGGQAVEQSLRVALIACNNWQTLHAAIPLLHGAPWVCSTGCM